jgi:Nucleotide modification associated domain 1
MKFKKGDIVKIISDKDDVKQYKGLTTEIIAVNEEFEEYLTDVDHDAWFAESELELVKKDNEFKTCDQLCDTVADLIKKSDTALHKIILDEIHDTYKRKNADYGNSFAEQYAEYGLLSAVIRLDDKMRRLKQLLKNEAKVKDESIRDTLMDLANYSIMTIMELDKKNEQLQ